MHISITGIPPGLEGPALHWLRRELIRDVSGDDDARAGSMGVSFTAELSPGNHMLVAVENIPISVKEEELEALLTAIAHRMSEFVAIHGLRTSVLEVFAGVRGGNSNIMVLPDVGERGPDSLLVWPTMIDHQSRERSPLGTKWLDIHLQLVLATDLGLNGPAMRRVVQRFVRVVQVCVNDQRGASRYPAIMANALINTELLVPVICAHDLVVLIGRYDVRHALRTHDGDVFSERGMEYILPLAELLLTRYLAPAAQPPPLPSH